MWDWVSYNLRRRMLGRRHWTSSPTRSSLAAYANKSLLPGQRYVKSSIPYTVRATFHTVLVTRIQQTYNSCPSHHHPRLLSAAKVWLTVRILVDVPMGRVKFNVNTEYAYIQNFKVLQSKWSLLQPPFAYIWGTDMTLNLSTRIEGIL